MAAPKGNKYALGNKGGQPTKYKPEYCEDIKNYFNKPPYKILTRKNKKTEEEEPVLDKFGNPVMIPVAFPTKAGWCGEKGIHTDTLNEWKKVHKEFSDAVKIAEMFQANILQQNGLNRNYDARVTNMMLTNLCGFTTDKQEIKQSTTVQHEINPADRKLLAEHNKLKEKYEQDLKQTLLDSKPIEGELVE